MSTYPRPIEILDKSSRIRRLVAIGYFITTALALANQGLNGKFGAFEAPSDGLPTAHATRAIGSTSLSAVPTGSRLLTAVPMHPLVNHSRPGAETRGRAWAATYAAAQTYVPADTWSLSGPGADHTALMDPKDVSIGRSE